jgi:hypothetical protein
MDTERDMRKPTLCAIVLLGLAACSSDARWNEFRQTDPQLAEARELALVDCSGREECSQRWERAMEYVARYSATRIRHADSSGIETGRPLEAGVVYLSATRTPSDKSEQRSRISLKGMCKGMYGMDGGPGWLYASCASQIRSIEMNFRAFVLAPLRGPASDAA